MPLWHDCGTSTDHIDACAYKMPSCLVLQRPPHTLGSLSNDDDDVKENGKKNNKFRLAKQQPCGWITLFCTLLCRPFTTTTWKCLISRCKTSSRPPQILKRTTTQDEFIFLSWNPIESFRIHLQKICQHLTNWTRWNKRDKVWSSANSLFNWRFRRRWRTCCLNSLLSLQRPPLSNGHVLLSPKWPLRRGWTV